MPDHTPVSGSEADRIWNFHTGMSEKAVKLYDYSRLVESRLLESEAARKVAEEDADFKFLSILKFAPIDSYGRQIVNALKEKHAAALASRQKPEGG